VSTSLYSILGSRKSDIQKLEKKILFDYFGKYKLVSGKAEILTLHKGRDAIQAACTVLLNKGDQVITQAFSCYAVEEGILRAGMKPIYVDISQESTNLSVDNLDKVFKKNPQAKAVLIQHSLGIPADTVSIRNWCNDNGVLLFEDIAQSIGGFDKEGKQLGVSADAVIFSFGRDKIIDAISGGAVVFRNSNPEISEKISYLKSSVGKISFVYVYEDLIYPDITSFIRRTHHFILGKVILKIVKSVGLLGSPIKSKTDDLTFMHPTYAKLSLL